MLIQQIEKQMKILKTLYMVIIGYVESHIQKNFNGSSTDGSFTIAI